MFLLSIIDASAPPPPHSMHSIIVSPNDNNAKSLQPVNRLLRLVGLVSQSASLPVCQSARQVQSPRFSSRSAATGAEQHILLPLHDVVVPEKELEDEPTP